MWTSLLLLSPAVGKPNVLFLMCDSMDGRVVDEGSREAKAVELPFLRDFFASQGTSFTRTYSNSPQCVPSRTSMCTGRHTHQIEAWNNGKGLAASPDGMLDDSCVQFYGAKQCAKFAKTQRYSETIFSAMAKLGYDVNLYGKVDIGAGLQNNKTWRKQTSATGFHSGPDYSMNTRSADIRKPTKDRPTSKKMLNDHDNNVHPEDWATVRQCEEWIEHLPGPGAGGSPFFLHCSVNIPHPAFGTNATWLAKVREDHVTLPPWAANFPAGAWHPYDSYMSESKHVTGHFNQAKILEVRRTYYAMCAETDYLLGRVWTALKARGYSLEDTYVVFVSDHGEMNMEHRQVWKNSMYEASARVPFQIAGPGISRGRTVRDLVSLVDVFPTLVDMAGETNWTKHKELAGRTVLPLAGGSSTAPSELALGKDFVLSQYHSNMGNTGSFMIRSGDWKYIAFGHTLRAFQASLYPAMLYNVTADPDEQHDLSSARPEIAAMLQAQLRNLVDEQEVDQRAKTEDFYVYINYLTSNGTADRKGLEQAYTGFDDEDWAKLQRWTKEMSSLLAPVVVVPDHLGEGVRVV